MMWRSLAVLSCLMFGIGCKSATNGKYQGEPIATLTGRMTLADKTAVDHPVRLALAWFPYGDPLPSAIINEDVTYEGQFPQNFTFNIYGLPPAKALIDWAMLFPDAGQFTDPYSESFLAKAATGFLIAYQDLNGDGQLTMSKGDEPVHDKILGTTWGSIPYETLYAPRTTIEYNTDLWSIKEYGSSFYLSKDAYPSEHYVPTKSLPLDAGIEIALVDKPRLGLYACIDTWEEKTQSDVACGLELAVKPFPVYIDGYAEGDRLDIYAGWRFAFHPVPNQQGSINGHPMTFGKIGENDLFLPTDVGLVAQGAVDDWLVPGVNRLKLWSDDDAKYPPQSFEFEVSGKFELLEPMIEQEGKLKITWTKSEGAVEYNVRVTRGGVLSGGFTEDTSYALTMPRGEGPLKIQVEARTSKYLSDEEQDIPRYVSIYETPWIHVNRMARKTVNWP